MKVRQVPITYTAEQNIWADIPVDTALRDALRREAFRGDSRHVLRWLLQQGVSSAPCAIGWYPATRRGIQYIASRSQTPEPLVALTTAIFSSRTPVDLNMLATQLWDLGVEDVWLYGKVRPDIIQDNIKKFVEMRKRWETLQSWDIGLATDDLAKVWLFALTRKDWRNAVQDEFGFVFDDETAMAIEQLRKPITMYGKTGNFALNLSGYVGVITVDTHMFKPIFGLNGVSDGLTKLLHTDALYQHLVEDYTDLLEDLADELNLRQYLGSDGYSPAGLQAMVWVMRQKAGQDFTRPVSVENFPRLMAVLENLHLRGRGELKRLIAELEKLRDNPKVSPTYRKTPALQEEIQKAKAIWQREIEENWITPLKDMMKRLDEGAEIKKKETTPRTITAIREQGTGTEAFDPLVPTFIEEIHRRRTEGKKPLGGIETQLKAGLSALAKAVNQPLDMETIVADIGRGVAKIQEAVHLPHKRTPTVRKQEIQEGRTAYEQGKAVILDLLRRVAETPTVDVPVGLFLSFADGSDGKKTYINAFWRRMMKDAKLLIDPQTGGLRAVLTPHEGDPITIHLNQRAIKEGNQWVFQHPSDAKRYRIIGGG